MNRSLYAAAAVLLSACSSLTAVPQSAGEVSTGFKYIPLDPLPVSIQNACSDFDASAKAFRIKPGFRLSAILDSLPDNAVRMAVKQYDSNGKLSFGVGSIGVEGKRYQVVLDYVNADTSNIRFYIKLKNAAQKDGGQSVEIEDVSRLDVPSGAVVTVNKSDNPAKVAGNIVIPVYVGVGLRLTADLQVLHGTVNLSSLGAIAADVEAGKASGSLVVQTLGLTGKQVSTSLPLPSELNQTTVQNAILALGSIKAIIYDVKSTVITPRVTGIYLPIRNASEDLVNSIVSELARGAIPWTQPCESIESAKGG